MTMAEGVGNVFRTAIDNMKHALQQLEGGEGLDKSNLEFNLEDFWLRLCVATKCLSNEVTKLCLAFSKPPLPGVTQADTMLRTLETAYLEVLSAFYSLPKSCGLMLRKEVNLAVLEIMHSLITVVTSVTEQGDKVQKERLVLTGCLWNACEAVEHLPQNNLQVTCKIVQTEESLVLDALQEIEKEVATDQSGHRVRGEEEEAEDDNSKTWSDQDRELLFPCMGLVKTARLSLKRIHTTLQMNGKYETEEQVSQLDDLVCEVKEISPAVDDLVSCMYPPMNKNAVKSAVAVLKTRVEALLHMVKQSHYIAKEDTGWTEFLLKAVDHNNNKLQPLLISYK